MIDRRSLLAAVPFVLARPGASLATPRWQELPPTPALPAGMSRTVVALNGIDIFTAEAGSGAPVVMLHGGLANSDYFGLQVAPLARDHRVILMDSRGHGRSTRDDRPFGYDLMTEDVVALLDHLRIAKASIVGWSDGAIVGLDVAMRHPARLDRLFAFGSNIDPSGLKPDFDKNPVFASFTARARHEYEALSPTPKGFDDFVAQIGKMWASQPHWEAARLRTIAAPTTVADGQYDEGIERAHTEAIAAAIPGAGLSILPDTSHFAFLQAPELFSDAVTDRLDR